MGDPRPLDVDPVQPVPAEHRQHDEHGDGRPEDRIGGRNQGALHPGEAREHHRAHARLDGQSLRELQRGARAAFQEGGADEGEHRGERKRVRPGGSVRAQVAADDERDAAEPGGEAGELPAADRFAEQGRGERDRDERLQRRDQAVDPFHDAVLGGEEHAGEVADLPQRPDQGVQGQVPERDPAAAPQQPHAERARADDEPPGQQRARGRAAGAELGTDEPGAPRDDERGAQQGVRSADVHWPSLGIHTGIPTT